MADKAEEPLRAADTTLHSNGKPDDDLLTCGRCGAVDREVFPFRKFGVSWCSECFSDYATEVEGGLVEVSSNGNGNGAEPAEPTTWTPVDLGPYVEGDGNLEPPPALLERSDGERLFYAAKIHSVAGEPESGKGWLALYAAKETIEAGGHVLYIDFEDEASTVVGRLLALGLDPEALRERFHYVRPDEPLTDEGRAVIDRLIAEHDPRLAIFDGFTDALEMHGIDLRDNTAIAGWMRDLPTRLRRAGAAVVLNDHVIKDSEHRGRWPIGGQHKLAKADVAYSLRVEEALGRGLTGRVAIRIEKDRPGHVRRLANGRTVAKMVATGAEDGTMAIALEVAEGRAEDEVWRPTRYMEKVSKAVEAEPGLNIRGIRAAVPGSNDHIDHGREVLVREGWMEVRVEGSARCHYVLHAYRDDGDEDGSQGVPESVPEACRIDDPEECSRDRAGVPPRIGGTRHAARSTVPDKRAGTARQGTDVSEMWPVTDDDERDG